MYIARQPIFREDKEVYGYELLFRGGKASKGFDGISATHATASVLTGLFESGLEKIVEDKKAFINFDEVLLKTDLPELIDKDRLVVEILETVVVDDGIKERIEDLSQKGYRIALDDFEDSYDTYPLVPIADIIKYDLVVTPLETIKTEVIKALKDNKILLAEKIETEGEFDQARKMGFKLFQGYFFSKPSIVGKKNRTKTTSKTQYLRLIQELQADEPSYQKLAEIVEKDVNLAYRLMRVISGRAGDDLVYSIKRALTYMGLKELERWIHVLMIQELGANKPKELMRLSLIRSKFSELVALTSNLKRIKHEAAMMGLFSTIDALLDMDMEEALLDIPLPGHVLDALIRKQGTLASLYELVEAYEHGDWLETASLSKNMGLDSENLYQKYLMSVEWARETMDLML
ncbi:EAL and HDOD domain-containing protein [Fusibacter tunisiensis]|uniref:EAL and modified HD-GYP domain-containing signal transduction protein n=1 Tax=Fusibacter tunisiensis TaxID=1008308 RepID=A0ABS2MSF5_9FIRM|nr:EAL domain-containing protein [Fusibacter tunisiensis]MBM7562361.1 EAL and modified HD-GYP domain-containing signal transduction protein [Fusibacter tunisiensis]